jgi:hypothetical protein
MATPHSAEWSGVSRLIRQPTTVVDPTVANTWSKMADSLIEVMGPTRGPEGIGGVIGNPSAETGCGDGPAKHKWMLLIYLLLYIPTYQCVGPPKANGDHQIILFRSGLSRLNPLHNMNRMATYQSTYETLS